MNLSEKHSDVTINHLLNHTSGLHDPLLGKVHLFKMYFMGGKTTMQYILKKVNGKNPYFYPGSSRKYSNTGYVLLGLIIENVTNKSFSTILECFLDEFKLKNTFYSHQDKFSNCLATGYDLDKYHIKGKIKANVDDFPVSLQSFSYTSGEIVSTASDVSKFLYNIFNTNILDNKSKRKLRLYFRLKKESNIVLRTNIGHMCGYYNFSGYVNSKNVSIVVLTNLTYSSSGVCLPEKVADKLVEIMVKNEIL